MKLLAVNIDEGEPGTFKDRFFLESDPHRFFEGMLIASEVVGIDKIYKEQKVNNVVHDHLDQKLNYILTEKQLYNILWG